MNRTQSPVQGSGKCSPEPDLTGPQHPYDLHANILVSTYRLPVSAIMLEHSCAMATIEMPIIILLSTITVLSVELAMRNRGGNGDVQKQVMMFQHVQ